MVSEANLRQASVVEPTAEAEAGWVQTIRDTARLNLEFRQACTPGYYNGEGRAGADDGLFAGLYGPGPVAFFALVKPGARAGWKGWRSGREQALPLAPSWPAVSAGHP